MPAELRFGTDDIAHIKKEMGLTEWWSSNYDFHIEDENHSKKLVREFAYRMFKSDSTVAERTDNLYRGLKDQDKSLVIKTINALINGGVLSSESIPAGIGVRVVAEKKTILQQIASNKAIPSYIEQIWK